MSSLKLELSPPDLDEKVREIYIDKVSSFEEVEEIYYKKATPENNNGEELILFYITLKEDEEDTLEKISEIENELLNSLPGDYKDRYEFFRLFTDYGMIKKIVKDENLTKIHP